MRVAQSNRSIRPGNQDLQNKVKLKIPGKSQCCIAGIYYSFE